MAIWWDHQHASKGRDGVCALRIKVAPQFYSVARSSVKSNAAPWAEPPRDKKKKKAVMKIQFLSGESFCHVTGLILKPHR